MIDAHELDAHELDGQAVAHELDAHELDAHELDGQAVARQSAKRCAWCDSKGPVTWAKPASRCGVLSESLYACEEHVAALLGLCDAMAMFRSWLRTPPEERQ